ncbi:predicted protein [Postia placenta Mad-698-R]|nr:predicted protein [Postia placenta Mad-698-R]
MSLAAPPASHQHGLVYPPAFLDALPVLQPRPAPHPPVRALSATQFAQIHLDYLTSHAPDSVLFPFLHGLEGDNDAQNAFFVASPQAHTVPRFRGLVWVAADDEHPGAASSPASTPDIDADLDDDLDDDDDDSLTDSLESIPVEMPDMMDIDVPTDLDSPSCAQAEITAKPLPTLDAPSPLLHRISPRTPPTVLTSSFRPRELLELRTGEDGAASCAFVEPRVPEGISLRNFGIQVIGSGERIQSWMVETICAPNKVAAEAVAPEFALRADGLASTRALVVVDVRARGRRASRDHRRTGVAHLGGAGGRCSTGYVLACFGPGQVPEDDIVVYSPKGDIRAALSLAEKFKHAVEAKRAERCERYPDAADDLITYNVFVLDASPAEISKTLPHLVMRTEDVPAAHTDSTDAHAQGEAHPAHPTDEEIAARLHRANSVDFACREKEEMRDLTQASEIVSVADPGAHLSDPDALAGSMTATRWEPSVGQVFLGNTNDVPLPPDHHICPRRGASAPAEDEEEESAFDWRTNDPVHGFGYDICIECHDFAPFPTSAHVRAAEDHLGALERRWAERCAADLAGVSDADAARMCVPPRPPPSAATVIHLPFPSSPPSTVGTMNSLLPFLAFLESLLQPPAPLTLAAARAQLAPPSAESQRATGERRRAESAAGFMPSSLPPPSAFPTSFFPAQGGAPPAGAYTRTRSTSATFLSSPSTSSVSSSSSSSTSPNGSTTSSNGSSATSQTSVTGSGSDGTEGEWEERIALRTRPTKILVYSADGYTESSVLALSLLMYLREMALPEAYLTLQLEKRRSFFVYPADLPVLRRLEGKIERERERERRGREGTRVRRGRGVVLGLGSEREGESVLKGEEVESPTEIARVVHAAAEAAQGQKPFARPAARSVSFAVPPAIQRPDGPAMRPLRSQSEADSGMAQLWGAGVGRPRASTLPAPVAVRSSIHDHQVWFNDPRFDGSFPSRVLPFLYLGNLNHASNAYMLHALGITHVVSVGECALVPPPALEASSSLPSCTSNPGARFVPGKGPGGHGSLFIEEREGRIKVLDIKGVCDDGIDTLEPQLEPICEWIDKARQEGGKVLVHCRVGVSRSATVTIAYVMKHLGLPLVDAYLVVRSRRLSVLIQPNMRLLYNLLGWEVKLAKQRAGGSEDLLKAELARSLNWPTLAKEVHALNEKYLH